MKTTKTYQSIYEGIVIQNNDPAGMGRVKVYIPAIHADLILEEDDYKKNFNFGEMGENVNQQPELLDITKYIDVLRKKITQWARVMQPMSGEVGDLKYNSSQKKGTPSDNDDFGSAMGVQEENDTQDGPGAIWKDFQDVHGSTSNSGGINVNPNSGAYPYAGKRSHLPKGSFGTIGVNTHVWVIFVNGNPLEPLVLGASPSAAGTQSMFTPDITPGEYENASGSTTTARGGTPASENIENQIYRAGSVRNTGAMTETIKSTTGESTYSLTHKSGTGSAILDDGTSSNFASADKQNATMGNEYADTRGSKNVAVAGKYNLNSKDDYIVRIGSLNTSAAQAQKSILEGIHDTKNLFEIQRTEGGSIYSSTKQKKSGTPKPCPECSQGKKYPAVNSKVLEELLKIPDTVISWAEGILQSAVDAVLGALSSLLPFLGKTLTYKVELPKLNINFPGLELINFPPPAKCKVCRGKAESPFSYDGDWAPEPEKEKVQQLYEDAAPSIAAAEASIGSGGNASMEITRNMVINVGCAVNTMSDIRIDKKGKKTPIGITVGEERTYQKQGETPLVEKVHVDDLAGGTFTLIAGNGANFICGSRGLNFDCFGCTRISGSHVDIGGAQVNISSQNEVNLSSGSALNLKGAAMSLGSGSGQILVENNLGVSGNAILQGGAHVEGELCVNHVTAPLEIQKTEMAPLLMGQTHPKASKKLGYLQKGTQLRYAPMGLTGLKDSLGGECNSPGGGIITIDEDTPIYTLGADGAEPDEQSLYVYPHNHLFRNLPLTLTGSNKDVRAAGAAMEGKKPVPPSEVKNGMKGPPELADANFGDADVIEENQNSKEDIKMKLISFKDQGGNSGTSENQTTFEQESNSEWDKYALS